jgi:hypothetical protein
MFNFEPMRHAILVLLMLSGFLATQAQTETKGGKRYNYTVTIDDASFAAAKPDQGATLTGYWKNGMLYRLEAWYGFNYGGIYRTFFYWEGKLITVTEIHKLYNGNDKLVEIDSIEPCFNAQYIFEDGIITSIKQKGTYSLIEGPQDKNSMQGMYMGMSMKYVAAIEEKAARKRNRKKLTENS